MNNTRLINPVFFTCWFQHIWLWWKLEKFRTLVKVAQIFKLLTTTWLSDMFSLIRRRSIMICNPSIAKNSNNISDNITLMLIKLCIIYIIYMYIYCYSLKQGIVMLSSLCGYKVSQLASLYLLLCLQVWCNFVFLI